MGFSSFRLRQTYSSNRFLRFFLKLFSSLRLSRLESNSEGKVSESGLLLIATNSSKELKNIQ
jgi:hypothetical protein